ncbi:putative mitochondrial protein, partial [Mucuna pruriens]
TKDLGHLKYFLGIEVAQSKEGIVIFQRKYALDILQETSMSNCRPVDSPMNPNMKLIVKQGKPYSDPERYRRLVVKESAKNQALPVLTKQKEAKGTKKINTDHIQNALNHKESNHSYPSTYRPTLPKVSVMYANAMMSTVDIDKLQARIFLVKH